MIPIVRSLEEALSHFIRGDGGECMCICEGYERKCHSYEEALEFFGEHNG